MIFMWLIDQNTQYDWFMFILTKTFKKIKLMLLI